jgi:hypothetical protein
MAKVLAKNFFRNQIELGVFLGETYGRENRRNNRGLDHVGQKDLPKLTGGRRPESY